MGSEAAAVGPSAILDMAQEWKGMGDSMVKSLEDCFSGIESREKHLRLVSESLVKRSRDLEERERELEESKSLIDWRSEQLSLREETLDEQLRLVRQHIEELESSQCEVAGLRRKELKKLKEIEKKEKELDLVKGLLERQLDEVGKKLNEFDTFQNGKLGELALKEELLCKEKREFFGKWEELASKEKLLCKNKRDFVEEVKLANEKLKEKQRLGYGLIKRLESALDMLGGMKAIMDDKLKEIELREIRAHESLTSRLNEADSIRESLEKRFKELEDIEKELDFSQGQTRKLVSTELKRDRVGTVKLREEKLNEQQKVELQMVENEQLELKQGNMLSFKKEYNYADIDYREKNMSSARESLQTHKKENFALRKKDLPPLAEACRTRELESERKRQSAFFKEQEPKQSMLTDTSDVDLAFKPDKSAELGRELPDRKALELLISDHQKNVGMMEGEIYRILARSSDPANLVLVTVQGFYGLHSGKLDLDCKMRRAIILLLEQLTKMSPKIQNCVTVAAVKLAFEWKSKLSTNVEDPMEALAFLHFVAAFQLSSHFHKNELFNFMKLVGRHKQTPELCHTLGLTWKIPGYIEYLINHKEYLLASTYTCEYQFMDLNFKQAAILNYYVAYSKRSAITRAINEGNTFEAREKAIGSEIDDLRAAIAHIIKYGLESDYSPNILTARIQQLEAARANLRSSPFHGIKKDPNKWKHHHPSQHAASQAYHSVRPFKRRKHNSASHHQQFGVPAG